MLHYIYAGSQKGPPPDIIDCNLKKDYQILTIFGTTRYMFCVARYLSHCHTILFAFYARQLRVFTTNVGLQQQHQP